MARRAERIRNRLALERLILSETVETMAHRCKTTPTTFSKMERGLTNPRPELKARVELETGYPWEVLRQPVDLTKAR